MFYCTEDDFLAICERMRREWEHRFCYLFIFISLFLRPSLLPTYRLHTVWLRATSPTYSVHKIGNLISFKVLNESDSFFGLSLPRAPKLSCSRRWIATNVFFFLPNMEFIAISVPFFNVLLRNRNVPGAKFEKWYIFDEMNSSFSL